MKIVISARDFGTKEDPAISQILNPNEHEIIDYSQEGFASDISEEDFAAKIGDADILIASPMNPMSAKALKLCPKLKMLSLRGIGFDKVDLDYCHANNIVVARAFGLVEAAVAEMVTAYIFYFARRIDLQTQSMHRGEWNRMMMSGVKTRTLGLVGFGGIGKEIAKRANALGMEVSYYARHPKEEWEKEHNVTYKPLDELLATSDYVSVNIPLNETTKEMCDEPFFSQMKKGSIFINISRSGVVKDEALISTLRSEHIAGAAIDVFPTEPCTDSPYLEFENVVLTPHTSPYTTENFVMMNRLAAQNAAAFIQDTLEDKYTL